MAQSLEIIPFTKFKKYKHYKSYSKNIDANMQHLGFCETGWRETDGKKSKEIVENACASRDWNNGIAVWRKRASDFDLQIINIYYKTND